MPNVLLTRPRIRSSEQDELHRLLTSVRITVHELPMISFEFPKDLRAVDRALTGAAEGAFSSIILSSPTSVHFFAERANELGILEAIRLHARFGAVGMATAKELSRFSIEAGLPVPLHGGAHELAASFQTSALEGKAVLLLQSQIGLDVLEHALTEMGAHPVRVTLYHTEGPTLGDAARLLTMLESGPRPDVIAFFSPSAVQYFVRTLAEMASGMLRELPALATIGETTAKAVEEALHRRPEIVARKSDQASLAEDIIRYLQL